MAAPSLTYSLTNETTADASQVMQNFNDLKNGITDGTKDLTISALTCNGAVSFKGTVALGDASADDITVTGSLASTIPIKTTNTYDIGSATLGLAGAYFGTGSTQTARIVAAATLASSRTYTMQDFGAAGNIAISSGWTTGGTPTIAADTGTWTLNSTAVFRYLIIEKTMWVNYNFNVTRATGSPTEVRVTVPASKTVGATTKHIGQHLDTTVSSTQLIADYVSAISGNTFFTIFLSNAGSAYSTTDQYNFLMTVCFEIQ